VSIANCHGFKKTTLCHVWMTFWRLGDSQLPFNAGGKLILCMTSFIKVGVGSEDLIDIW
jgi:hypothetical protein